jgi:hypothetical protein
LFLGRRASLCSALAPGFHMSRLWRWVFTPERCTANLNSPFLIFHVGLPCAPRLPSMKNEKWKMENLSYFIPPVPFRPLQTRLPV